MSIHAPNPRVNRWAQPVPPSWTQFALWAIVGPILVAGLLATFTPLIVITTPIGCLVIWAIGSSFGINGSAWGAVTGVGISALALGPLTPLWFVAVVGLGLIALGLVVFISLRRAERTKRTQTLFVGIGNPSQLS